MIITDLEKSILKTVSFFDLLQYPLTLLEIHKWLFNDEGKLDRAVSLSQLSDCLDGSDVLKTKLAASASFYCLAGRQSICGTRQQRYIITRQKYRLARKGLLALALLPFVESVFLCNNFGYNNLHRESDIDIFIIASPRRLFLTRLFATLAISLLGLRPGKHSQADRLCLSFYVSSENLDFHRLRITEPDIYFDYWLSNLLPAYDTGAHNRLLAANSWLAKTLPNLLPIVPAPQRTIILGAWGRIAKQAAAGLLSGRLGDRLEAWAKKIQLKKISNVKRQLVQAGDSRVIIDDRIIKLHENDRRLDYLRRWQEKLNFLLADV